MKAYTVNNGRRAQVSHALYTGLAGIVEQDGQTLVSFFLKGSKLPAAGESIAIDGEAFRVISSRRSTTAPAMIVLAVSAVTDAPAQS